MQDKLTKDRLSYLKTATEIQDLVRPVVKQGGTPLTDIYYNIVLKKYPICENTFRNMLKADTSHFKELMQEYRQQKLRQREERLARLSKRRIRNAADEPGKHPESTSEYRTEQSQIPAETVV